MTSVTPRRMTLNRIRLSLTPTTRCLASEKGNDPGDEEKQREDRVVLGQPVPRYVAHLPGYGVSQGTGPKGAYRSYKA